MALKNKKIFLLNVLLSILLTTTGCCMFKPPCFNCPGKKSASCCGDHFKKGSRCDFENFCCKAPFCILMNKKELDLSAEQESQIKDLMKEIKKNAIKKESEISLICVDIGAAFHEDTLDLEKINKLIDQKYELKKQNIKSSLSSYAQLLSIFTPEQKEKFKEIKKNCAKGKCACCKGSSDCPCD